MRKMNPQFAYGCKYEVVYNHFTHSKLNLKPTIFKGIVTVLIRIDEYIWGSGFCPCVSP